MALNEGDRRRRRMALAVWRVINPPTRGLAGIVPWWVLLETRGRTTGKPRRVPLAAGPVDGSTAWLVSVHGEHASFARNIAKDPRVRLKLRGRWRDGTATVEPIDERILSRFNAYARAGPTRMGIEPKLVRIELD
jgi:deazaflavin-dependent oxidoreductase (nitroreductase family)